jgi:hypothetical protein
LRGSRTALDCAKCPRDVGFEPGDPGSGLCVQRGNSFSEYRGQALRRKRSGLVLIDDAFSRGFECGCDRCRRFGDIDVQDCRDCLRRVIQQRGSEKQDQACLRLR